ncbi:hypothetical protein Tco_1390184, partial [Tanacetum coccineum]
EASWKVRHDLDAPVLISCKHPGGKMAQLTHDQLAEILKKQERMKIAKLSKPGIMKVVAEEVKDTDVIISGSKEFVKHQ